MDYFLLLCSLLLPAVCAVEGKTRLFSPLKVQNGASLWVKLNTRQTPSRMKIKVFICKVTIWFPFSTPPPPTDLPTFF